jgi:predicted nucleic acid-binding protein
VIVVDTSVWIDLLRDGLTPAGQTLFREQAESLAVTGPIVMEVLAGSRRPDQHQQMLDAVVQRDIDPVLDFAHAAAIFRAVRSTGHTPRSLNDCLIASVALRFDDAVAHRDVDFERIAQVTGLISLPM